MRLASGVTPYAINTTRYTGAPRTKRLIHFFSVSVHSGKMNLDIEFPGFARSGAFTTTQSHARRFHHGSPPFRKVALRFLVEQIVAVGCRHSTRGMHHIARLV